jgi:hypothetical protein
MWLTCHYFISCSCNIITQCTPVLRTLVTWSHYVPQFYQHVLNFRITGLGFKIKICRNWAFNSGIISRLFSATKSALNSGRHFLRMGVARKTSDILSTYNIHGLQASVSVCICSTRIEHFRSNVIQTCYLSHVGLTDAASCAKKTLRSLHEITNGERHIA